MSDDRLSAIATHLYVRLRRDGGRVIDVIWLTRNQDYAREVLRLARMIPDAEVQRMTDTFEQIMFGTAPKRAAPPPPQPIAQGPLEEPEVAPETAARYRGHLR